MKKLLLFLLVFFTITIKAQDPTTYNYRWEGTPNAMYCQADTSTGDEHWFNLIEMVNTTKLKVNFDSLIILGKLLTSNTLMTASSTSLSISSNTLSLKNGTNTINSITLPIYTQSLSISGSTISLSGDGSIVLPAQITQTITGGNGITISSAANTFTVSKTKRQETYTGTTNSSGLYTVTYSTAYSVAPNVQYNIGSGGLRTYSIILTASSTTGFTVKVENRTDIAGLLPTFANVNGQSVDILVTEK